MVQPLHVDIPSADVKPGVQADETPILCPHSRRYRLIFFSRRSRTYSHRGHESTSHSRTLPESTLRPRNHRHLNPHDLRGHGGRVPGVDIQAPTLRCSRPPRSFSLLSAPTSYLLVRFQSLSDYPSNTVSQNLPVRYFSRTRLLSSRRPSVRFRTQAYT